MLQKLSVIVPARNEAENLISYISSVYKTLNSFNIEHEIIIVDDGSTDNSKDVIESLANEFRTVVYIKNKGDNGFGRAVRIGLDSFSGDAVAIMMADCSDSPNDLVKYWDILNQGYDCAFGSRFIYGSKVIDYPKVKYFINRIANVFIKYFFNINYNDITNAFKMYSRETIEGCKPFISPHFNLTVEIPLKAIIRGYSWKSISISWKNRTRGVAKLKIREMGSRYFFIIAYLWLEKFFSRGDYMKR